MLQERVLLRSRGRGSLESPILLEAENYRGKERGKLHNVYRGCGVGVGGGGFGGGGVSFVVLGVVLGGGVVCGVW